MNEDQQLYVRHFYSFFLAGETLLDWDEEDIKDATRERAESMLSNVDVLSDRFTSEEWKEILSKIISENGE